MASLLLVSSFFFRIGLDFYDVGHVYLTYPNDLVRDIWIYGRFVCFVVAEMMVVDLILLFVSLLSSSRSLRHTAFYSSIRLTFHLL